MTTRALRELAAHRSERAVQAAVLAYLRARGVTCWANNRERAGRERADHVGFKGISDIIGWRAINARSMPDARSTFTTLAQFVAVEIKKPGQLPTRHQQAFLDLVNGSGGIGFVATSVDEVEAELKRRGL